ncbi:MAG TPA: anhydro-N-acetylmuramic acid kinase, partial [Chitinophagaceae bacterium]|nr:anhydro-N-acetylmuramic acid kinase [Chitinophagaceae bacterium]
ELQENGGRWTFEIRAAACYSYTPEWKTRLQEATQLQALDYALLHTDYGHYLGREVNRFIEEHALHYQVALIASHGHTTFHLPARGMTAQLGDGAALAAETGLPVVSDLRALDVAFGGQGAPIVPIAEKLLLTDYTLFLNLGGIANLSVRTETDYIAFDVCPANRVLNLLAGEAGLEFDEGGALAASGNVHAGLLLQLNELDYYRQAPPKSLANDFGTDVVYPMVQGAGLSTAEALRTYVEHIAGQVARAAEAHAGGPARLLVTGGGALNTFLVQRLTEALAPRGIEVSVPDAALVNYKEALAMALIGVLRWRQEYNVLSSVTGARRDSIGGAVWIGQEA